MRFDRPLAKLSRATPASGWGAALPVVAGSAAALAATALLVRLAARRAERVHPPTGHFLTVDGVRLHFVDTGGTGPVVVLLHGNGAMIADMTISGVMDQAARRYRVIAFDRPGYGHSERPRRRRWTPEAQADLLRRALTRLGIERALVVGHSWGTLVALALALDHPDRVSGLVLASGYYFPHPRSDVALLSAPAIPVLGDIMRYTVSPLVGRAIAPRVIARLFAPRPVPPRFAEEFPVDLALRPWQIRASAEETALMVPATERLEGRYRDLRLPVVILAGDGDQIVDVEQAVQLNETIADSELQVLPGLGHMLHHSAPDQVVDAIDRVAERARAIRTVAA